MHDLVDDLDDAGALRPDQIVERSERLQNLRKQKRQVKFSYHMFKHVMNTNGVDIQKIKELGVPFKMMLAYAVADMKHQVEWTYEATPSPPSVSNGIPRVH